MKASVGRPLRRLLSCSLAVALALLMVGVTQGRSFAQAADEMVGPGESIQKAINAAHPGDTIVVKGVHREDVVIRKDGIKLRGEDAVIEPPARPDSVCSRVIGPEAICVLGDFDFQTLKITRRVRDVSVSGFTIRGFKQNANEGFDVAMIEVDAARNTTVAGNDIMGNAGVGVDSFGNVNTTIERNNIARSKHGGIQVDNSRNTTVAGNDAKDNGTEEESSGVLVEGSSVNTTIARNDLENNAFGTAVIDSPETTVVSNDISRSGEMGTIVAGQKSENAKIVGNHISSGPWGIFVTDVHGGSVVGNTVHDNCAGIWFEAFGPVGGFKVTGNTLTDNTRSCQGEKFGRKFSGIGIALLGASGMQVSTNHLFGNVPSGPTPISGGVVVATDPYFGVKGKPTNNTVSANRFGRNKPDIYWDKSGSGNSFVANLCDTSVPSSLCK